MPLLSPLSGRAQVPAPILAIGSLLVVQLGTAIATTLFSSLGSAGTSWIILSLAALCFAALVRHPLAGLDADGVRTTVALGVVTAGVSLTFMASLHRLPLGTASAVEFLGPLALPVIRARTPGALLWPLLAGGGVVLLTHPWQHGANLTGILFGLAAAGFWAAYILLAQRSGDRSDGLGALAVALPVAAVLSAPFGAAGALGHLSAIRLVVAGAVALLDVVAPYSLEIMSLRRMDVSTFGTLMCFEPAIGALIGLVLLGQPLHLGQLAGMGLVVAAGVGATRSA